MLLVAGCDSLFLQEKQFAPVPDARPLVCPEVYAGGRYVLVNVHALWSNAERLCREQTGGTDQSHLAIVNDRAELAILDAMRGGSDVWVGLTDRKDLAFFRWITNEPTEAIPWAPSQPDSNMHASCGIIGLDGIRDRACDLDDNKFICECDGYEVDPTRF